MTQDFSPQDMITYAGQIAKEMIKGMPEEEATGMVRDFVELLAGWQPDIREHQSDPVMLAMTALSITKLFELAFIKAYAYSEKQVQAREAIEKVLGDQS